MNRSWSLRGLALLGLISGIFAGHRLRAVVSEDALPTAAEWISAGTQRTGAVAYFRRAFTAEPGLVKAVLIAGADQAAAIYLNGSPVGTASGITQAVTLDVTRLLQPGPNLLAVAVTNSQTAGLPVLRLMLELARSDGRQQWVVTDGSWQASTASTPEWSAPGSAGAGWRAAHAHGPAGFERWGNRFAATVTADAYNSWMLARGTDQATAPASLSVPPGFSVALLRTAQTGEDSWIALAFDPQGRLTVAREQQGLLRFTLDGDTVRRVEVIENSLKECRGLLYAHDALYVNANNSKGFYRLRDTNGDGQFDEQRLLLTTEGGIGHGRNQLRLGPDGLIYLVHGDDVALAKTLSADSPVQQAANDTLLPALDPKQPQKLSRFVQVGHVLQTDKDGSFFRLFATGLRNPVAVAFNEDGELFTYEADMERDIGAPWYRPTRILHVVPGGDYGWRRGTANIPTWAPDTLPGTLDIGVGSPTGVAFGTGSRFPEPYQSALFVGDWAYGRILAVFLKAAGATYEGRWEEFLGGRPLNVTDLTFGPDGALYFVTGGRGTRSGLYRVAWTGPLPAGGPPAGAADGAAVEARRVRRELESWTPGPGPDLATIWNRLGDPDPWIRNAARRALERRPFDEWSQRALTETNATVAVQALIAVTRLADRAAQALILARLERLPLATMSREDRLAAYRVYAATLARHGWPGDEAATAAARHLAPQYPAGDRESDQDLSRLLSHLRARETLERTLPLLTSAGDSDDRLHYLMWLWGFRDGWNLDRRRAYFGALRAAEQEHGARDYYNTLAFLRRTLTNSLSSAERLALGELVTAARRPPATLVAAAPVVQAWQLEDFDFNAVRRPSSAAEGRKAFELAGCIQCHQMNGEGGVTGPDLTSVASRFGPRDLLDHILNPAKAVDEKYRQVIVTLEDGSTVTGIVDQDGDPLVLLPPEAGAAPVELARARIRDRKDDPGSPMPSGLLDTLTRDQVLDLIAYLSGAK
ncbi:MAG: c-type cytochrome [Verrucomicrobiae bacterium]|nr:c-type cytochrome [Verrucomicrobiae bacterium]